MNQYFGIDYQGTEETKKEWEAVYPEMLAYADISGRRMSFPTHLLM